MSAGTSDTSCLPYPIDPKILLKNVFQDPLFVYFFSHTVEHKVNTLALELSEPTMNITEMTTERYEHPSQLEVFLQFSISIIRSYLNVSYYYYYYYYYYFLNICPLSHLFRECLSVGNLKHFYFIMLQSPRRRVLMPLKM